MLHSHYQICSLARESFVGTASSSGESKSAAKYGVRVPIVSTIRNYNRWRVSVVASKRRVHFRAIATLGISIAIVHQTPWDSSARQRYFQTLRRDNAPPPACSASYPGAIFLLSLSWHLSTCIKRRLNHAQVLTLPITDIVDLSRTALAFRLTRLSGWRHRYYVAESVRSNSESRWTREIVPPPPFYSIASRSSPRLALPSVATFKPASRAANRRSSRMYMYWLLAVTDR